MNIKSSLVAFTVCAVVASCSPLAAKPDLTKFFILSPISAGSNTSEVRSSNNIQSPLTIGLGPINFPDYLRRPEVVTLDAPNRLGLSDDRQWGEPLDKNFTRVLSMNLAQLLNTQRIEKYPWPRRTSVDYQIAVSVLQFETTSEGRSQLVARWNIRDGKTDKDLFASETTTSSQVGRGETGPSAALSNDLATLSKDIAAHVTELVQQRPSTTMFESKLKGPPV
jgi:uncharacterized lipoprotein YmbA